MNWYDKILRHFNRCHNCNSTKQLEIHHRIFRSELEEWVLRNIELNKDIYKESRWEELYEWWLDDVENLVLLCAYCHKERIHKWDRELREFYRNSFTEPNTMFNILFQKPITNLF